MTIQLHNSLLSHIVVAVCLKWSKYVICFSKHIYKITITVVIIFQTHLSALIRLTPRNCPALADKSLYQSHPWFEMLVKIQEITRDLLGKLSDP